MITTTRFSDEYELKEELGKLVNLNYLLNMRIIDLKFITWSNFSLSTVYIVNYLG